MAKKTTSIQLPVELTDAVERALEHFCVHTGVDITRSEMIRKLIFQGLSAYATDSPVQGWGDFDPFEIAVGEVGS